LQYHPQNVLGPGDQQKTFWLGPTGMLFVDHESIGKLTMCQTRPLRTITSFSLRSATSNEPPHRKLPRTSRVLTMNTLAKCESKILSTHPRQPQIQGLAFCEAIAGQNSHSAC
jgi:hypothetical protein